VTHLHSHGTPAMQWRSLLTPTILGFVQLVLCVYAAVSAFSPKPAGMLEDDMNTICPRDTICSKGKLELVSLGISRLTAFWMYAPLVLVFLTKCHALRSMLHNSAVSVFVPFCDEHDFHMLMGKYIAGASVIHTIFHLVRWGVQSNLEYNWSTVPGRTGWIATIAMTLVIVPMGVPQIKQRLAFETRKGLHYFCIIAGICLASHAPQGYIGWVMGICTSIYILDLLYRKFFMTFKCISPDFVPLNDAVQITFKAPTMNFAASGGFVLVCIPSVNRWQWHPFTVFPSKTIPGQWCVLVGRAGNWTEAVYKAVEKKTVGPIWIQGCFPSSFSTAEDFDNLVLVAAGTGITNALSTIQKLEGGRRLNVIWVCRQASLINYYVPSLAKNVQGFTLIFYTGKSKGGEKLIENTFGPNMLFFNKRPDYMKAISSIIIGTETGEWVPDKQVEFADEFYRLVSPHANFEIGYMDVFHLMRLVFNRNNSGDNKVDRASIVQLYKAMTPPEHHNAENIDNFTNSFEWDDDGAVNMDKFVGGMRRFSSEENLYSDNRSCMSSDEGSVELNVRGPDSTGNMTSDGAGSMRRRKGSDALAPLSRGGGGGESGVQSVSKRTLPGLPGPEPADALKRRVLDGIQISMPDVEGGLCFKEMATGQPNSTGPAAAGSPSQSALPGPAPQPSTDTGFEPGIPVAPGASPAAGSSPGPPASWLSASSNPLLPLSASAELAASDVEGEAPAAATSVSPLGSHGVQIGGVFGDGGLGEKGSGLALLEASRAAGAGSALGDSFQRPPSDSDYVGEGIASFVKKSRRRSVADMGTAFGAAARCAELQSVDARRLMAMAVTQTA